MNAPAGSNVLVPEEIEWRAAMDDLSQALEDVGWSDRVEFARESAALLRAMATPSRLQAAHRFLALERLGMQDRALKWGMDLTADELLVVFARMSTVERTMSYSAEDVASLMDWDLSDVHTAARSGALYAYDAGNRLLFPAWQFNVNAADGHATLISDHLSDVIAAVPDNAVPGLVRAVMTLECPMIPKLGGRVVSAREYLLHGGSHRPVAAALLYFLDGSLNRYFTL